MPRADADQTKALAQWHAQRLRIGFVNFLHLPLSCLLYGLSSILLCVPCKKPRLITWGDVMEFGILSLLYHCDLTLLCD